MKPEVLAYLCCPRCRADLVLHATETDGHHVVTGTLTCSGCAAAYPITAEVPSFVPESDAADVVQTTSGFARNWLRFNQVLIEHAGLNDELFRDWIEPMDPATFRDQVVLEGGCGMGRWLRAAAMYAPRTLIGVDYSEVVYVAHANTRSLPHVHVVRADINQLPLRDRFSHVFSIGVVHHMPDPAAGFQALFERLAPGGEISCWVYGAENNGWITEFLDPVRTRFTSRLPHPVLAALTRALTLELWLTARAYSRLPLQLPYDTYIRHLRRYPFRYLEHIVYDHLVPSIAHYLPREELVRWSDRIGAPVALSARNQNSWRVSARRPSAPGAAQS